MDIGRERWIKTHNIATFLIGGYVFAMILSFVPLTVTDKQVGVEGIAFLLLEAVICLIPFVVAATCWWLWKHFAKPFLTVRQENLCLLGIWLLVTLIFKDAISYEPGAAMRHYFINILYVLSEGSVLSPIAALLGALAGTAAYKISLRWNGPLAIQVLLTIVIALAEWIALAVVGAVTGVGGVVFVLVMLTLAVLGISIKRYQNRQEQTWEAKGNASNARC